VTFEYGLISDTEKRELCLGLLAEFGVGSIQETTGAELIHSCCLPNTGHKNGDKNASASLNWQKLTYNCLGCGSSGGILWFIATCRGLDGPAAREWLGAQTGLGGHVMDPAKLVELITAIFEAKPEQTPIPSYDPSVLDPWLDWNMHHPYMTEIRGVPGKTLDHFKVGFADAYFDGSARIIIPLFWRERLVGWQARCLPGYRGPDKYRNSPDFPRERALYNHSRGRELVLVESPLSVLRHFHHVPQMQASFGAKVTDAQLRLCQKYGSVTLWFDNDEAGWKATQRVEAALSPYLPVRIVDSPYSADPADMDDDTVEELIGSAVPASLWKQPGELVKWEK
jgi:hypothetical protein